MEITKVDVVPISYTLPKGAGLGDARGFGYDRSTSLVRIETDTRHHGWGEAFVPGGIAQAVFDALFVEDVVGMDPFDVESLAEQSYTDPYHLGGGVCVQSVVSAVDVACWDVIGKEVGRPIHQLLGGRTTETLVPYASTMYFTEADRPITEPIERAISDGFDAVKIKIGGGIESDRTRVQTARELLGDDRTLMVDMNGNYRPDQALESIREIEAYDIAWVEEPVPPENLSGYRDHRSRVDVPLAAGEAHYGRVEFKRLVGDRLVDIVQPNLARCGGFSEVRSIAKLASTENVGVCPHVWNSGVGLAAAVQFAASLPDYPHTRIVPEPKMVEFDRSENPLRDDILDAPFDPTGGELTVPQEPGLGVDVDNDALERYRTD